MKDKIFIGWSGRPTIGEEVKRILESQYDYSCIVGGNFANDSKMLSIGDTVLQQIKDANQAIFIFENKPTGVVSSNLFFELGCALAFHGIEKIHCVKKEKENIDMPTDFDNSFVATLPYVTDEQFAQNIIDYFIKRQCLNIKEEKFYLINNRYSIRDKIKAYNSQSGSKCSDYELAQYMFFYYEASYMFDDVDSFKKEIRDFVEAKSMYFSKELNLAINICLNEADFNMKIKLYDNVPYVDDETFFEDKEKNAFFRKQLLYDDLGCFNEWAKFFLVAWTNYHIYLYSNNPNSFIKPEETAEMSRQAAIESLKMIDEIEPAIIAINAKDNDSILAIYRSHSYRTLYLALNKLGKIDEAQDSLEKSIEIRQKLLIDFEGRIDRQLYNNLSMEFYLILIDKYKSISSSDPLRLIYKRKMETYLQGLKRDANYNKHIKAIEAFISK